MAESCHLSGEQVSKGSLLALTHPLRVGRSPGKLTWELRAAFFSCFLQLAAPPLTEHFRQSWETTKILS